MVNLSDRTTTEEKTKPAPVNTIGPWTVPEFADMYRVCRATIYNWMSEGWLQSVKIGGARRILPEHDRAFREKFSNGEAA